MLPARFTGSGNTTKQVTYHYFSDKGGSLQDLYSASRCHDGALGPGSFSGECLSPSIVIEKLVEMRLNVRGCDERTLGLICVASTCGEIKCLICRLGWRVQIEASIFPRLCLPSFTA